MERTEALQAKVRKRIESLRDRHSSEDLVAALMTHFSTEDEILRYFDAVCQQDKERFKPHKFLSDNSLVYSNGVVSLHCHLPADPSLSSSCLLTVNSLKIRDCMFTFRGDSIRSTLLPNSHTATTEMKRQFLWQRHRDSAQYIVQLQGVTFALTESETDALCEGIDVLADHHIAAEDRVRTQFALANLRKSKCSESAYVLGLVAPQVWHAMQQFARKFDYEAGDSSLHFFDATGAYLKFASRSGDARFDSVYHAALQGVRGDKEVDDFVYEDKIALLWVPLIIPEDRKFSDRAIWSASKTKSFIKEDLLPRTVYDATVVTKFFKPDFERWVTTFKVADYFSEI